MKKTTTLIFVNNLSSHLGGSRAVVEGTDEDNSSLIVMPHYWVDYVVRDLNAGPLTHHFLQ